MMKVIFLIVLLLFCLEVCANSDDGKLLTAAGKACSQFPRIQSLGRHTNKLILGGDIANKGDFPWMAALLYVENSKITIYCGGTIISEFYVMTAAHCTTTRSPAAVRLGEMTLDVEPSSYHKNIYYIQNIDRHPSYSQSPVINDIALLRLTTKISFTNTIRPACLHTDMGDIDNRKKLIVTGWGNTVPGIRSQPYQLLKAELNTLPLSECNRLFFPDAFRTGRPYLSDGHYCAYDGDGKEMLKSACSGDSGGPLQLIPNNDPNEATIVGIVSFGLSLNCGWEPTVYTRVAYYISWIESIVWPEVAIVSITNNNNGVAQTPSQPFYLKPLENIYTVLQGSDFTLPCESFGNPYPTIIWKLQGNVLYSNVQQVSNILHISNAQPANSGYYICTAESNGQSNYVYTFIDIKQWNPLTVIIT